MRPIKRVARTALAVMVLVIMMSSFALAGGNEAIDFRYDDADSPSTSGTEGVGPTSSNEYGTEGLKGDAASVAAANPANCTTTADNPHPSIHVPGTINAVVRQSCPVIVDNNSTEAKLWERRWWGYSVIGGPEFSDLVRSRRSRISVSAPCRTNSIRVTGYGHYLWNGQHIISQEMSNTRDVAC